MRFDYLGVRLKRRENLKHIKMFGPLGGAWQKGCLDTWPLIYNMIQNTTLH